MANVRIKLNSAGIRALMKSKEIADVCESHAERLTRATGMPYVPDVYVGKTRVNAAGITDREDIISPKARGAKGTRTIMVKGHWRVDKNGNKKWIEPHERRLRG